MTLGITRWNGIMNDRVNGWHLIVTLVFLWLMAHGSWLMAHGSWLIAHCSWLTCVSTSKRYNVANWVLRYIQSLQELAAAQSGDVDNGVV
jgi:hypothetical protein